MSPSKRGQSRMSARRQIFTLGAILYELLTGRSPFQADSWNQLLQKAPRRADTADAIAHIPVDLKTICLKCLEKRAGGR